MKKANVTTNAKNKNNGFEWYVHYTPAINQQARLSKQILRKTPTEFQYVKRSVFMKKVNTRNFWTFELGTQEGININTRIIVGFQQRDRQDSQKLNIDTFYRPPVTSAQGTIGTEKYPDSAILLNYDDDYYSKRDGQIREASRALTKDDILKPYISDHDFRSSKVNAAGETTNDNGYNLYVFDIRYKKSSESAQPI